MRKLIKKAAIAAAVTAAISGCAYDQWAENTNRSMNAGWTEMLYGKQTVDATALPKGMVVNISYGIEGSGIPGPASSRFYDFQLLGDVTYTKACKNMLTFNVNMFNDAGVLVRTEPVLVAPYMAGVKSSINKDVMADPQMRNPIR